MHPPKSTPDPTPRGGSPRHISHAITTEIARLEPFAAVTVDLDRLRKHIRHDLLWRTGAKGQQLALDLGDAA
jgi:hypothetical protein